MRAQSRVRIPRQSAAGAVAGAGRCRPGLVLAFVCWPYRTPWLVLARPAPGGTRHACCSLFGPIPSFLTGPHLHDAKRSVVAGSASSVSSSCVTPLVLPGLPTRRVRALHSRFKHAAIPAPPTRALSSSFLETLVLLDIQSPDSGTRPGAGAGASSDLV